MVEVKTYAEYGIFAVVMVAILGLMVVPQGNLTSQIFDSPLTYQASITESSIVIKNNDDFQWNNVRILTEDDLGIVYECPKMLYLRQDASATIDTNFCFSGSNVRLQGQAVKVTILTNEGAATFLY